MHTHVTAWYSSDGQRGAPAKRKRGPASNDGSSGGPKLKQPKLLDCLFDDELSPIQVKGKVYSLYVSMLYMTFLFHEI